jgi:hypothetical protein
MTGVYVQLEYDTERSGDFAPLKHMPLEKTVVLGLVSTKNPQVICLLDLPTWPIAYKHIFFVPVGNC